MSAWRRVKILSACIADLGAGADHYRKQM